MKRPESTTSARRAFSSGRSSAYCALMSRCGISGTTDPGRAAAYDVVRHRCHDPHSDDDVHVAQVVVEAVVARPERPPAAGEAEAEAGRPDAGEREEARERQA